MKVTTPPIAMETRSSLNQWLDQVGFSRGNPFGIGAADCEPFVSECFVDPCIYDIVRDESRAVLIFASRGRGKTALRMMLASDCRPLQMPTVPHRSNCLAIMYTDFEPVLNVCGNDLARLTSAHHETQILHEACSVLLDALWQDSQISAAVSPPDRSLLASFFKRYNPALLSSDAVFRRLKLTSPEAIVPWPVLRKAVAEHCLCALWAEYSVSASPGLLFYTELVDDVPESLADLDSPVRCLAEFAQLAKRLGLNQIRILIDRLDEGSVTIQDPNNLALLIAPLIGNLPLMEVPGVTFHFFLPSETREAVMKFVRHERFHLLNLAWNSEKLKLLLRLRLRVYSEGRIQSLGKLCEDQLASHIEDEMLEAAEESPRMLLQLGAGLFEIHVANPSHGRAITEAVWGQTRAQVLNVQHVRLLRVNREMAQVYLGTATPVHLPPIPYRLLAYLYDSPGFRTSREIATAVWDRADLASDEKVRQNIKRVKEALKEAGSDPDQYLVNEPGRGYRLQNTAS
jgi:hypothetical protein